MKILHKSKILSLIIYENINIIFYKKIDHNLTKYAITERNVMSLTNHPFIVKLNYAF